MGRGIAVVVLALLSLTTQSSRSVDASLQIATNDVSAVGRIAAGNEHTCAINNDNTLWCWGSNQYLQLGVSVEVVPDDRTSTPTQVAALPNARIPVQVVAGSFHTCVRADDGTVWCWGDDGYGTLGVGATGTTSTPQRVNLPSAATHISAGGANTCAVLSTAELYCWGRNDAGQVGIGSVAGPQSTPQQVARVPSSFTVADVEVGDRHVCAVSVAGAVWCWGSYVSGRLGNTSTSNALLPTATAPLAASATAVSAGGKHTCVVLTTKALQCFGSNLSGQLGQSSGTASSADPVTVAFDGLLDRISSGADFTCGLTDAGLLKCFGRNASGELGNGATTPTLRVDAQVVSGFASDTVVDVVAGAQHACAVVTSGAVKCWGSNSFGQAGAADAVAVQTSAAVVGALNVVPTTTVVTVAPTVPTTPSVPSDVTIPPDPTVPPDVTEPPVVTQAPAATASPVVITPSIPNIGVDLAQPSVSPVITASSTTTQSPAVSEVPISPSSSTAPVDTSSTAAVNTLQTKSTAKPPPIRKISLRRGASVSGVSVASAVAMKVPKTSKGSLRISITTGGSRCVFRGSSIVGTRSGTCTVAVTLMPKVGKHVTRRTTITVR